MSATTPKRGLRQSLNSVLSFACVAILLGTLSAQGLATSQPRYYTPGTVDGVQLLPPPPEPGSAEQAADLASARAICKGRTPEQEAAALATARLSMFAFAPAIGDWFVPGKFPKTEALFAAIKEQIGGAVDGPKTHWNRKRPYQMDPELLVAKEERSSSYPSGHSTRGIVYSFLFAEIFPENREDILRIGRQIGWDRIIIGKHYPTDVFAGRVMGKAIFRSIQSNPEFQKAVKEARAEIDAVRQNVADAALVPAEATAVGK